MEKDQARLFPRDRSHSHLSYLQESRRARTRPWGIQRSFLPRFAAVHNLRSSKLAPMRRVAVTGLGAVTPLGNDARATWDAAVQGQSGIDWIQAFDAGE